jgi:nucleoid-associated protein YgaU
MNTANPFKVPVCIQRANLQQRRQDRVKKVVVGSIITLSALLVFLLVEGCMRDRATAGRDSETTAAVTEPAAATETTVPKPMVIAESKAVAPAPARPVPASTNAPVKSPTPAKSHPVYIVKSGDTLTRISKI